jgi:hypothetical protein
MNKKEAFTNIVEETMSDLNDRMDNLEAIKGENFCKAVKLTLSIYTLMQVATAHHIPVNTRDEIIGDMFVNLSVQCCDALGLDEAGIREAMKFAENMANTLDSQGTRASKILRS